ncbi:DEAD/DEAH box helicase [Candidatus Pacearchaeota archaeon]|nr:DEAD/DEAH box helicase [Candidatus Pacearchaeota archaeon]
MESFARLGLQAELIRALEEAGFSAPREIQEKTIPLAIAGKDIIGGSATGSGKTLAFGASIIEHAVPGKGVQALILTPTRELAEQVASELDRFSKYKRLAVAAVYGGVGIEPQIRDLQDADIVVGTPGRILDHLERRTLKLQKLKVLVLDEADRMLDMGFIEDVTSIIEACPKERQTMLFSATISPDIQHIANSHMKNPAYIAVEQYVDASKLKQVYYDTPQDMKFSLLLHLMKHEHTGLVMVFCNTQRTTDFVANHLSEHGIEATAIHGGLTQAKRSRIMEHFKSNRVSVLVCTDVAARGLDISDVSHVYNYDVPMSSKEYVHRIGRTARAGKEGMAVTIVSNRDYENFRAVLRDPDLHIEQLPMPEAEKVFVKFSGGRDERRGFGRGGSGGRSRGGFGGRRFGDRPRSSGGRGGFGRRDGSRSSGGRSFGGSREGSRGGFGGRSRFGSSSGRSGGSGERSSRSSFRRRF